MQECKLLIAPRNKPDRAFPLIANSTAVQEEFKKLPEIMATACINNRQNLPVRLMFHDEARFGRLSEPRACWEPSPNRPTVNLTLGQEFRYEYAVVSPWDGGLDYMIVEKMNTDNTSHFLVQVSETHGQDLMVMVLDGASSHKCKELKVPGNITLVFLLPYSPGLNPAEQI